MPLLFESVTIGTVAIHKTLIAATRTTRAPGHLCAMSVKGGRTVVDVEVMPDLMCSGVGLNQLEIPRGREVAEKDRKSVV